VDSIEIRPFRRSDRDQLTGLVNAHVAAVMPGVSVTVNTVMSQLEREPGEFIVDPWVEERVTLVAEQRQTVAAAVHLHRYADEERVDESYRGAGAVHWLVFAPLAPAGSPYWTAGGDAARLLLAATIERFEGWGVSKQLADISLPAFGAYGVSTQWPHIRAAYEAAGFEHRGHTEIIFLAAVEDLPPPGPPPIDGMTVRRSLGINGTRFGAELEGALIGYVETGMLSGPRSLPATGWADIGNLHVEAAFRRRGIATWLLAQVGEWLRLAGVTRLLDYAWPDQDACIELLESSGFRELTRTARGWQRDVPR
jgi:GNAT superfamily N-acetyltransferase